MTIYELECRRKELGYSYETIAMLSGVSERQVEELFSEQVSKTVTYAERVAIEQILKEPDKNMVREAQTTYFTKKQGQFTLEDYETLPDDVRAELIDGVLYEMNAPTFSHQKLILEIAIMLKNYIVKNKGKCEVICAPFDVQLDCDDKTMVEPDVMIVCEKDKITNRCLVGAPDFIVEILSPSTIKKDMTIKLSKYMNAGVREYWIVDLKHKRVIVYNWEQEEILSIYGFDGKVPVGIFDGKCEVNFEEIGKVVDFLE